MELRLQKARNPDLDLTAAGYDEDENLDDAFGTIQVEVVSQVIRTTWVAFTLKVDDDTTMSMIAKVCAEIQPLPKYPKTH